MASGDAKAIPVKNVALRITFPIFDADGDLVTGATGLDSEISKDGGTFADCTNEATEIATSSGMYYLDLTNTEMNADTVAIIVKTTSSGAKTTPIVLYTASQNINDLASQTSVNTIDDFLDTEVAAIITTLGTPVTSIAADIAAVEAQTDDIGTAGAGLTAVPWNAAWDAEVQSEVADALAVYDPPTHAELQSEINDVQADIAAVAVFVDTEVAAILADTNAILVDTADMQPKLGTPAGASISADIAAIEAQTDDIGVAGAGLTAIPWNAAWDAEVQSEATDALNAYDPPTNTELNTVASILGAAITAVNADTDNIQTRLPAALVSGRMDSSVGAMAADVITASAIAANAIGDAELAADLDIYQAKIALTDDDLGTADRYTVNWFKNGAPVIASITSPTIQVVKIADGSDLVASTAMTEIGTTEAYYYVEATNRVVDGVGYFVEVTATIDGATRTDRRPISRDS